MLWGLLFGNETAELSSVTDLPPVPPVQSKKNQKKASVAMNSIREYRSNRKSSVTAFCKYAGQRLADLLLESAKDKGVLKIASSVQSLAKESDIYSDLFGYSIPHPGLCLSDTETTHIQSVVKLHLETLGVECVVSQNTISVSVLPVMPGMEPVDFHKPMATYKTDFLRCVFENYSEYLGNQQRLVTALTAKNQEQSVANVLTLAKTTGRNHCDYQIDTTGLDRVGAESVIKSVIEYLQTEGFTVKHITPDFISLSFAAPQGMWYYDTEKCDWFKEQ